MSTVVTNSVSIVWFKPLLAVQDSFIFSCSSINDTIATVIHGKVCKENNNNRICIFPYVDTSSMCCPQDYKLKAHIRNINISKQRMLYQNLSTWMKNWKEWYFLLCKIILKQAGFRPGLEGFDCKLSRHRVVSPPF